jgi:hypothetical protein
MKKQTNLMIDEEDVVSLKEMARSRSFAEQKDVSYTDLIREAIKVFLEERGWTRG